MNTNKDGAIVESLETPSLVTEMQDSNRIISENDIIKFGEDLSHALNIIETDY